MAVPKRHSDHLFLKHAAMKEFAIESLIEEKVVIARSSICVLKGFERISIVFLETSSAHERVVYLKR